MDESPVVRLANNATDRAIITAKDPDVERVARRVRVDPSSGCWLWEGARTPAGYGIAHMRGSTVRVHRATYWWFKDLFLFDDYEVDHLCEVRHCCNPDHLEQVPHAVNVERSRAGATWAAKTHCPSGHPYSGDNLYVRPDGSRQCRTCQRARMQQRRARAKVGG